MDVGVQASKGLNMFKDAGGYDMLLCTTRGPLQPILELVRTMHLVIRRTRIQTMTTIASWLRPFSLYSSQTKQWVLTR